MKFYKQNDDGEYVDATNDVDALFRSKSDEIVRGKIKKEREKEIAKIREEVEETIRQESTDKLKAELKNELEATYGQKLDESKKEVEDLKTKLLRKTVAAEYGFAPEAEEFLGNGDADEMRRKADILKDSFGAKNDSTHLEKDATSDVSEIQQKTGIPVQI